MSRKKHINTLQAVRGARLNRFSMPGTAFFRARAGAGIKVRYGVGFFGLDRQTLTLNGSDYKKLTVGLGSVANARMQVRVSQSTDVTYDGASFSVS